MPTVRLWAGPGSPTLVADLASRGFVAADAAGLQNALQPLVLCLDGLDAAVAETASAMLRQLGATVCGRSGRPAALVAAVSGPLLRRFLQNSFGDSGLPPGMATQLARLLAGLESPPAALYGRGCRLVLHRPRIMGILNVTPDSFFAGSRSGSIAEALDRARQMVADGADVIDVGGESTRPGAPSIDEQEELDRVVPVIEALRRELDCPLSVDTTKSRVAEQAVAAGAAFVNDISGFAFDPKMAATVAGSGAGAFLMHTRGLPADMQKDTRYRDLLGEVLDYLQAAMDSALRAGIPAERLAVDPGIGFGKDVRGNLELLGRLGELRVLGRPILLGTSRKSFIGRALDLPEPAERLAGTLATVALGVAAGAQLFRVHDVRPAREAALMAWSIMRRQLP
ncbi:dihydropteroate synthase [Desulfuromonas sp. CSMB_57]|uniref:dihydropteroate synthase n=1 Tax=Desulfuromonas sp. CSMB_57 TaxID=2807629 RepID=UPI0024BDFD3A|nr:dihydropteroate synthase [Desulfuromonas sp. CSMB_57]